MVRNGSNSSNNRKRVVKMAVNAPKTKRSRTERLLKAKSLSEKICQKTDLAELSTEQLEIDVKRIFDNVKASRSRRY